MDFNTFCVHLNTIHLAKGPQAKAKELKHLFSLLQQNTNPDLVFQHLRLMLPEQDRERQSYGIKRHRLGKILIKMLQLPAGHSDQLLLASIFKASNSDVGPIICSIVRKYIVLNDDPQLTIEDANAVLDRIAAATSDQAIEETLHATIKRLRPEGLRWFFHILLKDLPLGVGLAQVLNCLHPDGADFYKSSSNLRRLCHELLHNSRRLNELALSLFTPFAPQLSKRCDSSNLRRCFPLNHTFFIENKFDGERFQLHYADSHFRYFSRNGYDFTSIYGETPELGLLSPIVYKQFQNSVKRVILDGEMMLWNKKTNSFGSKGLTFDVKKLKVGGYYQPCFCVFDCLLLNDDIITNRPLSERLRVLALIFKEEVTGSLLVSEYRVAEGVEDVVRSLNESVDRNEEGIVVKSAESVYKFGDRNKSGWFKVKLEYFEDALHDLDVAVIGATYGASRQLSTFHVGVYAGACFKCFGRIGTGLNGEELDVLGELFARHGSKQPVEGVQFGKNVPDLFIEPEKSCTFLIRATELTRATSDHYRTPYVLRFPRILKVRTDKAAKECLSLDELMELTVQNKAVIKLNKRHLELDEVKTSKRARKEVEVVTIVKKKLSTFLTGKRFFVHLGKPSFCKEDVYMWIKKAGGVPVYNIHSEYDFLITSRVDKTIKAIIAKQHNFFHVISLAWLERMFEADEFFEFEPEEVFYFSRNLGNCFGGDFDYFGDSFTAPTSLEALRKVFNGMDEREEFMRVGRAVLDTLGLDLVKSWKFGNFVAYFDCYFEVNQPSSKVIWDCFFDRLEFQYYCGGVSETLDLNSVNLVVIKDEERRHIVERFLDGNNIKIVLRDYIHL